VVSAAAPSWTPPGLAVVCLPPSRPNRQGPAGCSLKAQAGCCCTIATASVYTHYLCHSCIKECAPAAGWTSAPVDWEVYRAGRHVSWLFKIRFCFQGCCCTNTKHHRTKLTDPGLIAAETEPVVLLLSTRQHHHTAHKAAHQYRDAQGDHGQAEHYQGLSSHLVCLHLPWYAVLLACT